MNNMRDIMNIVESVNLDEAGFISRLANKGLASIGNKKAQGRSNKNDLTKRLKDNYYRWLGRTNKEGTLADLQSFLQQVNFTNEQINQFTKTVVDYIQQNPEETNTNESMLFELNASDFVLSRNEVDNIMDAAAAYAYEKGLYNNSSNSSNNSSEKDTKTTSTNNKTENVTRANLFSPPVVNTINDLGVSTKTIPDMLDYSKNVKYDQLDKEIKDNLSIIGYAILKYNKTGLQ